MPPQELILSACSAEATSSSNLGRAYVPSIQLHDLLSNSTVHAFKTSVSAPNALSHVGTQNGTGGGIFAVQEGKAIVNVWAWQKVSCITRKTDWTRLTVRTKCISSCIYLKSFHALLYRQMDVGQPVAPRMAKCTSGR